MEFVSCFSNNNCFPGDLDYSDRNSVVEILIKAELERISQDQLNHQCCQCCYWLSTPTTPKPSRYLKDDQFIVV